MKTINPSDLVITVERSGGSQWFPEWKRVRIIHIPTGLQASNADSRSQHYNRVAAMRELADKLKELGYESPDHAAK